MTSLNDFLPLPGSSSWRKTRSLTTDSEEDSTVVRHVVIREVWLEKQPWPHAVSDSVLFSLEQYFFIFNSKHFH